MSKVSPQTFTEPNPQSATTDSGNTMKCIPFMNKCEPDALKIMETTKPTCGEEEVLIEVKAFGVNFADVSARKGQYPDAPPFPFVAGYEVAGYVREIGAKVTKDIPLGARVTAMTMFGGYAEYAVAQAAGVALIPDSLDFATAASIPVQWATAYHCLHFTGPVVAGDTVLVHSAAGGVGQCLIQLCQAQNLDVYCTAGSDWKLKMVQEKFGIAPEKCICYGTPGFRRRARAANTAGFDITFNALGGSFLKQDLDLIRPGGRVVAFGAATLSDRSFGNLFHVAGEAFSMATMNAIKLLMNSRSLCGVNMKKIGDDRPELLQKSLDAVMNLLEAGTIQTVVSRKEDWSNIGDVHASLENRQSTGKLVLTIGEEKHTTSGSEATAEEPRS